MSSNFEPNHNLKRDFQHIDLNLSPTYGSNKKFKSEPKRRITSKRFNKSFISSTTFPVTDSPNLWNFSQSIVINFDKNSKNEVFSIQKTICAKTPSDNNKTPESTDSISVKSNTLLNNLMSKLLTKVKIFKFFVIPCLKSKTSEEINEKTTYFNTCFQTESSKLLELINILPTLSEIDRNMVKKISYNHIETLIFG